MTMMDERPEVLPVPNGQTTPRRHEWAKQPPLGWTVRKMNGQWVCTKMGVYVDTDEVMKKIRETVEYWETEDAVAAVQTIRLDLRLGS